MGTERLELLGLETTLVITVETAHFWVYLNSGTYRTLVKTKRNIFPVESFARIDMSPIAAHLHMLPFAALKSSSHGRTLTRRARVSVHEAVQPESIGARKIGKELDLIWL